MRLWVLLITSYLIGACAAEPHIGQMVGTPAPAPAERHGRDDTIPAHMGSQTRAPAEPATSPPGQPSSVHPGINDAYFEEPIDHWTGIFENERRDVAAHRDRILDALGLRRDMVVADVGAGTGLFTNALAARVGPAGRVYAVDIVPKFLEHVRASAEAAGHHNLELVLADPLDAKLPAQSVDLAFLCNVYHHIEYPAQYMPTLRAALRPAGELVVVDLERIEGEIREPFPGHVRAGRETVIVEISAAGFELVSQERITEQNYLLRFKAR